MIKKEPNTKQLALELIKKSKTFLVITHARPDGDAISSSLSLKFVLEKIGKKVDVVIPDEISPDYSFLPGIDNVTSDLKINRDLVISIGGPSGKVGKISYNKREDGIVDLVITPSEGEIKKESIKMDFGKSSYDVLIILDTPDLNRVNTVYEHNKEVLKNTEIINIDHHPSNVSFGGYNIVDTSATSTCEILFALYESLDKSLIDSDVATLLLTGIINDTDRFQNANTSPKALTVAAQLIAAGGKRTDIIRNIYKTHPLSTLKLWGKILMNIKEDKEDKIVWSIISKREIDEIGARETETEGVMNELISTIPNANLALLLAERSPGVITASMRTNAEDVEVDNIAVTFGGGGHKKAAGFKIEGLGLFEAEKMVIGKLKAYFHGDRTSYDFKKQNKDLDFGSNDIVFEEKEEKSKVKSSNLKSEDDFYAPSLSDVEMEDPNIVEEGGSILKKFLEDKKRKKEEKIDFATLEKELNQKGISKKIQEEEYDEDYE
uniref:DDH domain-containing protein n=1 Tax=candidate division CPR3 bacterium TaxID=2268181 RepID=A0A7C4R8B5_UNCC3